MASRAEWVLQEQAAEAAGRQVASVFPVAAAAGSVFFEACAFLAEQPRVEAGARHLCVCEAKGWVVAGCMVGSRLQHTIRGASRAA